MYSIRSNDRDRPLKRRLLQPSLNHPAMLMLMLIMKIIMMMMMDAAASAVAAVLSNGHCLPSSACRASHSSAFTIAAAMNDTEV